MNTPPGCRDPESSVQLRLAIIGCGAIASVHADALEQLGADYRIVACADPVEASRVRFAERFGVPATYPSQTDLLANEQIDLLLLATWPSQHEEQVVEAVEAGVTWVLCEKSIGLTPSSVARMRDAAATRNATLVEGFMWRHHPRTLRLADLIASGSIGRIQRLRAGFHLEFPREVDNWRNRASAGGGVPYDFTSYPVNALGAFASSRPATVRARRRKDNDDVIRELDAIVEYQDGTIAFIDTSYTAGYRQPLEIQGSLGTLEVENAWTSGTDRRIGWIRQTDTDVNESTREQIDVVAANPYRAQLEHLHECITLNRTPRFTIDESLSNITLLTAILAATEQDRPLTISEWEAP